MTRAGIYLAIGWLALLTATGSFTYQLGRGAGFRACLAIEHAYAPVVHAQTVGVEMSGNTLQGSTITVTQDGVRR